MEDHGKRAAANLWCLLLLFYETASYIHLGIDDHGATTSSGLQGKDHFVFAHLISCRSMKPASGAIFFKTVMASQLREFFVGVENVLFSWGLKCMEIPFAC